MEVLKYGTFHIGKNIVEVKKDATEQEVKDIVKANPSMTRYLKFDNDDNSEQNVGDGAENKPESKQAKPRGKRKSKV